MMQRWLNPDGAQTASMGEKSKRMLRDSFFSSYALEAQSWPVGRLQGDVESCMMGKKNKQACHRSWEESLVQQFCQKAASISYIINIT